MVGVTRKSMQIAEFYTLVVENLNEMRFGLVFLCYINSEQSKKHLPFIVSYF